MSNVDSTQHPKTLDEALKEIDDLKSQLSGSDLKVFSQNRELRAENQKLKEEIRQLTEQCVSQTFKVRGLEKSEQKLQESLAQAEAAGSSLRTRVESLEAEIEKLRDELEERRSKELHLSQELERTVASNAEELERIRAQHSQEFEAKSVEYSQAIQALEQRVEQFKEEFLSQEIELAPLTVADSGGPPAHAFELLSSRMEEFLGFPGRALVEQVFRLSGVDPSSNNPSELEETFEVLQDTASQLVRSEEQEKELTALLQAAWLEIGLGDGGPNPPRAENGDSTPPAPPSERANETVEAEPAAAESDVPPPGQEEAPQPEAEPVTAEAAEESDLQVESPGEAVLPEEQLETAAETDPEEPESARFEPSLDTAVESVTEEAEPPAEEPSVHEAESLEQVEVEVEESVEPEAASIEPDAPETVETAVPAPEQEPESAEESSEDAEESEESIDESKESEESVDSSEESAEEQTEVAADDTEASVEDEEMSFDRAAGYLEEGRHSEALPIFETLQQQDPSELAYQVGRVASLAGLSRFQEAVELGRTLAGSDLGETREIYLESMESALIGYANSSDSDMIKKECLLDLVLLSTSPEQLQSYLDEADEIPLRISREGELSLLQARHRVSGDDVTEYLIDALHSLSDQPELFALLKTNLERYPELKSLADFLERLLNSPRAESLEAEVSVKELLGQGETVEELLDETDPGEEALVQVFLEHLIPRSEVEFDVPSEEFEELMLEAEPAAFVGSLRQALRSVDYTLFFDEIEVLSYDGDEEFLLRTSPEPKPTLLFGGDIDDVPPEELRFLVLRELFSMYRRHSHLAHISAGLDDQKRVQLVSACIDIFSEFEAKVPQQTLEQLQEIEAAAAEGGQSEEIKKRLESFLREVYLQTEHDSFLELGDFLYGGQLNRKWLDPIADSFGAKQCGLVVASYAICRECLDEEEFEQLEESGFGWLYSADNRSKYTEVKLRLQRLWSTPLKALISEPEE